jgi:hypothetical protein
LTKLRALSIEADAVGDLVFRADSDISDDFHSGSSLACV